MFPGAQWISICFKKDEVWRHLDASLNGLSHQSWTLSVKGLLQVIWQNPQSFSSPLQRSRGERMTVINQAFIVEQLHFEQRHDSLFGACQMAFKRLWEHEEKDSPVWQNRHWNRYGELWALPAEHNPQSTPHRALFISRQIPSVWLSMKVAASD